MSLGRRLFQDGMFVGGSSLAVNGSTFIFYAAAVRSLGVSSGGALLAIIATTLVLSVPATVAGVALGTESAALRRDARRDDLHRLITSFLSVSVLASLSVVILGVSARQTIGTFFNGVDATAITWAVVLLAAMLPTLALRGMLQGVNAIGWFVTSNLTECIGRLALSGLLLLASRDLAFAFAGLAIIFVVVSLVTVIGLLRSTGLLIAGSAALLRESFAGSGPTLVAMGSLTLLSSFDSVAARHFLSARESGYYNSAALAGRALMTALAFAPAFIMPKLTSSAPSSLERQAASVQVFRIGLIVCIASALFFVHFPNLIIRIVAGPEFLLAAPLVAIYGIAASALALATIIASIELVRGPSRVAPFVAFAAMTEICAICFYHPDPGGLARVVAACHCLALCSCLVGARLR